MKTWNFTDKAEQSKETGRGGEHIFPLPFLIIFPIKEVNWILKSLF